MFGTDINLRKVLFGKLNDDCLNLETFNTPKYSGYIGQLVEEVRDLRRDVEFLKSRTVTLGKKRKRR